MKCPDPTLAEGLAYILIACMALMALVHGTGERLPARADFTVASR